MRAITMSDRSWVVSRGANSTIEHKGDSLLWTSMALGTMDCDIGQPLADALQKMLSDTQGGLYRHPDLPNEWSIDGAIGFYWGLSHRVVRCHDEDSWRELFAMHIKKEHLAPYFDTMRAVVADELGLGDAPNDIGSLGSEMAAWAFATVSQRAAAYRVHLGYLVLDVINAPKGKAAYCGATEAAKIPLIDHFCGRAGLQSWVSGFQYNLYEYRHQRAIWETADGNGLETPAIDYLVGVRELER